MPERKIASTGLEDDPLWYKDAIIYELHVRSFFDSDNDGIGDFRGLTSKLDYLKDLGITAIWLLPFYPSPLKDDGYDISDYTNVHHNYGTLRDFRTFMREATRRGIRVITELVINHTSDQHPWFQRSRRAPKGSSYRNFYVWSDSADKFNDARIIFKDFESSNWAWDPEVRAYYWHRFYSHQPDLNYDNPMVRRAVMRTMDFWLGMGVSGLRLDAIPYLYQREGTSSENLPETHQFIKELRRHMDQKFKNRILLAEANQWPEDTAAYFGEGDECHMNFHFPVMPRMFMAIRMEDRFPLVDIIHQTPHIPENCQWAMFLRNHDELTLEMVTDEERDYMYRVYANDQQARINFGIRRRLAPLLNNDRDKIELMNGLLFSLPGTPVVYYGDEIGMGDNFYLGDRNGVRTPMQWSADRNAGFSRANPQSLYLPVIIDPEYHYEAINVEAQQNNPDSRLWWMKRLISLRKRFKAFGRGSLEFLYPENHKVLAFLRKYKDETILVVANLSRNAQHAYLDLCKFQDHKLVELFGGTQFPVVQDHLYPISLSSYAFYWFSLEPQREAQQRHARPEEAIPVLPVAGQAEDLFKQQHRAALEGLLVRYIRKSRWFGGKAGRIISSSIRDVIPVSYDSSIAYFIMIRIQYSEGEPEDYILSLAFASGDEEMERIKEQSPSVAVAMLQAVGRGGPVEVLLYEALASSAFDNALIRAIGRRRQFKGEKGELFASRTRAFRQHRGGHRGRMEARLLRAEQSNTSVVYDDRFILKLFRRPGHGLNPDLEIGRYLTERAGFAHIPPVAGALEYRQRRGERPTTVGILQGYVPNQGDAWQHTIDSLGYYFERVLAQPEVERMEVPSEPLLATSQREMPSLAQETIGPYLASARLLGQRTAEMHLALASADGEDPGFAPKPISDLYRRSLYQSMRTLTGQTFRSLRRQRPHLPEATQAIADRVISVEGDIMKRFGFIRSHRVSGMLTRVHGDYHLGQVLYTGNDFVIIDFEGEPARPVSERRLKRSPLRDVAGMLRSFHYAAHAALLGQAPTVLRPEDVPELEQWAAFWYRWISAAFLDSYMQVAAHDSFIPSNQSDLSLLLDTYLLEKAVYEINYEMNNRPEWVRVPLEGILMLVEAKE